jgi:ketosteroid isomerase-like protein
MPNKELRDLIERMFAAVEARDVGAVLAFLTDDAILIDPHYPRPRMAGKPAIAEGLRWGFGGMKRMRFSIVHYFESEDGRGAAVEVDTAHVLKNGRPLNFPQAFVFDTCDGLISRIQAYEPYGPGGILGLVLALVRLRPSPRHRHSVPERV